MKKRQRIMDQQQALKAAAAASAAGSAAAAVTPLLMGIDMIPLQSFPRAPKPPPKSTTNEAGEGGEATAMIENEEK